MVMAFSFRYYMCNLHVLFSSKVKKWVIPISSRADSVKFFNLLFLKLTEFRTRDRFRVCFNFNSMYRSFDIAKVKVLQVGELPEKFFHWLSISIVLSAIFMLRRQLFLFLDNFFSLAFLSSYTAFDDNTATV